MNQDREGTSAGDTKILQVIEACLNKNCASDRLPILTKTLVEFQEHLAERSDHCLGYPVNLNCDAYVDLAAFLKFQINNVGDPFKESNYGLHSRNFEIAILHWFAQLWEIEKDECWGYVTNGGTESNFHALLLGRELFPDGVLYASEESHYSVDKAARMFRMDFKKIATLHTGEIDCTDLKSKLLLNKDKPAIINLNIGTTFKGGVDDLDLVLKTLGDCGFSQDRFYIHCDAALFGLVFPFLEQASSKFTCSFKKPIESICVSAYKFLGLPMPTGILITRKRNIGVFSMNIEYIANVDNTISGSRNGHTSIFMWYTLSIKGHIGFRDDVVDCLRNAQYLRHCLKSAGISSMLNEGSMIVVFERPSDEDFVRYWQLSCTKNMAHVVVMPHVTVRLLDDFVDDLVRNRKKNWSAEAWENGWTCLAKEIGTSNCVCSQHANGFTVKYLRRLGAGKSDYPTIKHIVDPNNGVETMTVDQVPVDLAIVVPVTANPITADSANKLPRATLPNSSAEPNTTELANSHRQSALMAPEESSPKNSATTRL